MVQISADIPASLKASLEEKAACDSGGVSSVVTAALAELIGLSIQPGFLNGAEAALGLRCGG
jgi:hypothetical protein